MSDKNTGHGWVNPREDGAKARCGRPAICPECRGELMAKELADTGRTSAVVELRDAAYLAVGFLRALDGDGATRIAVALEAALRKLNPDGKVAGRQPSGPDNDCS